MPGTGSGYSKNLFQVTILGYRFSVKFQEPDPDNDSRKRIYETGKMQFLDNKTDSVPGVLVQGTRNRVKALLATYLSMIDIRRSNNTSNQCKIKMLF